MSNNPYYSAFAWWWADKHGDEHGPYALEREALRAALKFLQPKRKSLCQRLKDVLKAK